MLALALSALMAFVPAAAPALADGEANLAGEGAALFIETAFDDAEPVISAEADALPGDAVISQAAEEIVPEAETADLEDTGLTLEIPEEEPADEIPLPEDEEAPTEAEDEGGDDLADDAEIQIAANGTTYEQGDYTYSLNSGSATITKYKGSASTLTLPTSVTYSGITYRVDAVGSSAFKNCVSLKNLTLPDTISSLGDSAFSDCTGLTSITINGSIQNKNTYSHVFYNTGTASGGYSVTFGGSATTIPTNLFRTDSDKTGNKYAHVKSVAFSDGVTAIGGSAFQNCYDLANVTWGSGLTSIGNAAFMNDEGLTTLNLPGRLTTIDSDAFRSCVGLKSVTLPASTNALGDCAFYDCTGLTSITINGSIQNKNTYSHVFYNTGTASGGYSVTFGGSATTIPANLFRTDSDKTGNKYAHVKSVTFSDDVTDIGVGAFMNCYDLETVSIGVGLENVRNSAFYNCAGLSTVRYAGTQAQWQGITIESNNEPLTSANIIFGASSTVAVASVTLDRSTLALTAGGTATLTATVLPANATNKTVTWQSSNAAVATVNSNGVVTAVKAGTATITAISAADSSKRATCAVTVEAAPVLISRIDMSPASASVQVGQTATITATMLPTNASNLETTYSVSSSSIFKVNSARLSGNVATFVIEGVSAGSGTLTVRAKDGSGVSGACQVQVTAPSGDPSDAVGPDSDPVSIRRVQELLVAVGLLTEANVNGVYDSATIAAVRSFQQWVNEQRNEQTVEVNGLADALTIAYLEYSVDHGMRVASSVTSVTLSQSALSLTAGGTATLTATVYPTNASNRAVTWFSSNTAVATVSASGVVTAVAAGMATITAAAAADPSKQASCTVKVTDHILISRIEMDAYATVTVGQTATIIATKLPANATKLEGFIHGQRQLDLQGQQCPALRKQGHLCHRGRLCGQRHADGQGHGRLRRQRRVPCDGHQGRSPPHTV